MQVFLLRHGIAADPTAGMPDHVRELTAEGARKVRDVCRVARDAGVAPELIVTSPYLRARQTAEVAAQVLGYREKLVVSSLLVPGGEPAEAWAEARSMGAEQILLVTHEPFCGRMLAYLLGSPGLSFDYKKGALARVDVAAASGAPRGSLQWLLTARLAESARKGSAS